jgi:hypothetical protein
MGSYFLRFLAINECELNVSYMNIFTFKSLRLIVASVLIFSFYASWAQPNTFETTNVGVDWDDATTWTKISGTGPSTYPVAGDAAIIKKGHFVWLRFGANGAAASLVIEGDNLSNPTPGGGTLIVFSPRTLTLTGSLTVQFGSSFQINSGATVNCVGFTVASGATSVLLNGNLDIGGGAWSNSGAVSPIGGNVYDFSSLVNTSSIALSGTINGPSQNGGLTNDHSSIITNSGVGASISASGTSFIYMRGTGSSDGFVCGSNTFSYTGTNTIITYGASTINGGTGEDLSNITVSSGTLNLTSTSGNNSIAGTLTTASGTTATIQSGSTWDFTGTTPLSNSGTFQNDGTCQFVDFTNNGAVNNNGTLRVSEDFVDNGTSFVSGASSTVEFNGADMTLDGNRATAFMNFTYSTNNTLRNKSGSSYSFSIAGNYLSSGSGVADFTLGPGTVSFVGGAVSRTINGGNGGTTFNNMVVSNNLSMVNSASNNVRLIGTLDIAASRTFDASGNSGAGAGVFTLVSSGPEATASIAALPAGASVIGRMTIQRFFNSGTSWKYLSIPISSTFYVSDLQAAGFAVNGHFASGGSDNPTGNPAGTVGESMFTWDAANQEYLGIGWGAPATNVAQLSNTTGYVGYFYGASGAISLRGTPKTGNAVIPLNRTKTPFDNLIPNPYPSAIDFKKFRTRESSLVGTQMSIQTTTGNLAYLTYDGTNDPLLGSSYSAANAGVLGGSWKGEIALGQSFWISPGAAGNLTLLESDKTTAASTYAGKTDGSTSTAESISVRLSLTSGIDSDETVFLFTDKGSLDFVERKDFVKKLRTTPDLAGVTDKAINFYSSKGGNPLVFNFLPLIDCKAPSVTVKMGVNISPSRQYTINFSNAQEFSLGYVVKIFDKFLNKETNLTTAKQYSFSSTAQLESYDVNRFELKFEPRPLITPVIAVDGTKISIVKDAFVQWYKDGKEIVGATSETYVATESGSYTVKSGSSLNCQAESLPVVLVITSLDKESVITAYPNPVGDIVTVNFPSDIKITGVSLLDSKGSQNTNLERVSSTDNSLSLDISDNPSGLYFIRLKSDSKTYSIKILKK